MIPWGQLFQVRDGGVNGATDTYVQYEYTDRGFLEKVKLDDADDLLSHLLTDKQF